MHELSARFLRGGSGGGGRGGGGGGSHGGGSHYGGHGGSSFHNGGRSSHYGGHGGGNSDDTPILDAILPLVILSYCCYYVVCHLYYAICRPFCTFDNYVVNIDNDPYFEAAVSNARRKRNVKSTYDSFVNGGASNIETYNGHFDMIYRDRGTQLSGIVKIQLKNNNEDGYIMDGTSNDVDGSATITEGFISYSGKAWWVEETFSGTDRGLKVLTEGQFDFSTNTFTGNWLSSTRMRGPYIYFRATRVTKSCKPDPQAEVLGEMSLDEDIPIAIPMAVAREDYSMVEAAVGPIVQALPETTPLLPRHQSTLGQGNERGGTNTESRSIFQHAYFRETS